MFLNAVVHTPVGIFRGSVNDPNDQKNTEDLIQTRDVLQKTTLTYLVLFGDNGKEICLQRGILDNSVIEYTIRDVQVTR